ncbi:hypothetical protein Tco_1427706 [Tanacetum coccineum]
MFMTIQSSVKDKILATLSETSKVENAPAEMLCKTNVVIDALRRKERVKPRRVRAMAMTIRYGVRGMMLAAQSEAFKQENGMMRTVVMDEAHASSYHLSIQYAPFEALYGRKCRSPVLWAEIGESSLIGPEWVQETTDKVVGDQVLLKVSPCKGVVGFGKKGKLAPRIGPVVYRLRLPEELSGVHDTFHVSNLKKCLADASLHMPLDEIKVEKTLRFVEEPVEISDREVKSERDRLIVVDRGTRSIPLFVDRGTRSVSLFVILERDHLKILGGDQLLMILCGYGTKSLELETSFLSMTMLFVDRGTHSVPLFVMLSMTVSTWFDVIAC